MKAAALQLAMAIALAGPAAAADLYVVEPAPAPIAQADFESRWQVSAALYLWMPGLDGSVGVGGFGPFDVDASFSDLLEDLDFAFMGVAEARYDRFGIFGDLVYTKLSTSGTGPAGFFTASVETQLIIGTIMGEYRVIEQGRSSVDVMAGARVWGVQSDLDIEPGGFSADGEKVWVDPMIGVKARAQGASSWYLTGWGMIGGFGVSSDIDWDLFGGVGYEFNDRFSLVAGYRGIGVDYSDGGFVFDVIEHGPVLGGVFRF